MANRSSHHSSGGSHTSSHHSGSHHTSSHHSASHHTSSHHSSGGDLFDMLFSMPTHHSNNYHHAPPPMGNMMPPPPPPSRGRFVPPPTQINNYYYNNSGNTGNNSNANYNNNTTTNYCSIPTTAIRCKSKETWQRYAVSGQTFEQYINSNNFKGTWYDPHGTACNLDMQDPYIKENYKPVAKKERVSKIGGIVFWVSLAIKILALPIIDFFGLFIESDAVFNFIDDFIWYAPIFFMIASIVVYFFPKNAIKKQKQELAQKACQYYEGMYEMYGEDAHYNDVNMFGM